MYTHIVNTGLNVVQIFSDYEMQNKIAEILPKEGIVFQAKKEHDLTLFSNGKSKVAHTPSSFNHWDNCSIIILD